VSGDSDNEKKRLTTLQTVERALAFMETVAQARRPPRLKEVAQALGLNTTTSYHLLNTLLSAGYLVRDADGSLRIGSRAAILYQGLVRHFVIGRDLMPVVEELSARTGETAYVAALNRQGVVIQALAEGDHAVRATGLYVGFSGSEHIRASGKAVLAHLPAAPRDAMLARCMADATEDQLQAAAADLEKVREQGWAIDEGRFQDGVCCISAPFFGSSGAVAGSVSVSVPATRFAATRGAIADAVRDAAAQASTILGHDPTGAPDPVLAG
jgi:DNA-binding IclR family transcriptional regulator